MKKYKEFLITAEPFNADLLSSILWELEITGINEDVNCLRVFAYQESNLDRDRVINQLNKLRFEGLLRNFSVEESVLEEKNWNEEWEKSLNIIHVTDKIVIKPSFKDYDKKKEEIVITIDPKMSFGTGEHQTTKLVIQLLERYTRPGMKILDAGTGTGILSIAAVKLGAARVIGFDTDEWCYENAQENCKINSVSDQVEIRIGDINIIPENNFDLILANIQKNILLDLADNFSKKLSSKGVILLSGLLREDEKEIIIEYKKKGFRHLETRQMDEWIAMGLIKN